MNDNFEEAVIEVIHLSDSEDIITDSCAGVGITITDEIEG